MTQAARALAVAALLGPAACAAPVPAPVEPSVGVGIAPSGVSVAPRVGARLGRARLGIGPQGASVGTSIGGVGIGIGL